jgi:hypothetical protein
MAVPEGANQFDEINGLIWLTGKIAPNAFQ